MNTIDPTAAPPEDDNPAAEYVLGVLGAAERRAIQARIDSDPAFARDVGAWEQRFMPLVEQIMPVSAPDYVWARILSALNLAQARPTVAPRGKTSWWDSLGFWRTLSGGALAAAAAFAAVLYLTPAVLPPVTPGPLASSMASTLLHDDGSPGMVVTIDPTSRTMTLAPVAVALRDDRVAELWLIPEGQAPRSLGLVDAKKTQRVAIPDRLLAEFSGTAILAVTLEPPGGAPGGVPSGPIIAKGGIAVL